MARRLGFWLLIFIALAIPRARPACADATAGKAQKAKPQPPADFGQFIPHPSIVEGYEGSSLRMVALVYRDGETVRPQMVVGGTMVTKDKPHYEVIEWCTPVKTFEPGKVGMVATGGGSGLIGPNCYLHCEAHAVSTGFSIVSIGPLAVKNPITIKWIPGSDNEPEPRDGLTIFLHHSVKIYGEVYGAGIGKIMGSARATGEAKTQSQSGSSSVKLDLNSPFLGMETECPGDNPTYTTVGLKSGAKLFITATGWVAASTKIIGTAMTDATAEVTWEASCPAPLAERLRKPDRRPTESSHQGQKEVKVRW